MKSKKSKRGEKYSKVMLWAFFLGGILYAILLFGIIKYYKFEESTTFWRASWIILIIGIIISYLLYKSLGMIFDFIVMMCLVWWLYEGIGYNHISFLYLPLVTSVMITISHRINLRVSVFFAWVVPVMWFIFSNKTAINNFNILHYLLLTSSLLMLLVFTLIVFTNPKRQLNKIDFIISSYSGNTAHFANKFIKGAKEAGTEVVLHRFHYYKSFNPAFKGDSLVIAFPVYGGKPPWPFLSYLLFKLPRGRRKPAFILYTCVGGAENAGILCWFILTLKGYRVIGRNYSIYPLNVPTFRLGPRRLWKFIDSLIPVKKEVDNQIGYGREFTDGIITGIPFIFSLTPFFLIGIILDNKPLDKLLYRNHVLKKRCDKCGMCVTYCPAKRLKMINGYPKPKGECMICLGCVNICPKNAMHFWFWVEWGNQYKPKYKELIVKKKL